MRRFAAAMALGGVVLLGACDSKEKAPGTDFPLELAARKEVQEIELAFKQGKVEQADALLVKAKEKYGQTRTYQEAEARLQALGLSADLDTQKISLTGKALIDLQNLVLNYYNTAKRLPAPGQIKKPLDAWNNETYWVAGTPEQSFDLLFVSAGPDSLPGTGDEIIVAWTEEDIGGYKNKQTGEIVGKRKKSRKKLGTTVAAGHSSEAMSVADLSKMDAAAGYEKEETVSLSELASVGKASAEAGQPQGGDEMVLSLEEIAGQMEGGE